MMKQIVALLAIAALCECATLSANGEEFNYCGVPGENDEQGRVLGGTEVNPGEWPWMAYIYLRQRGLTDGFICGGTLINSDHIITAAHCLKFYENPDMYEIVLGEHAASEESGNEVFRKVSKIGRHEKYNPLTMDNDIALLKLNESVKFTSHIRPICLPSQGFPTDSTEKVDHDGKLASNAGKKCTVAGWGKTEKAWRSDVLQELSVTIYPRFLCLMLTAQTSVYVSTVQTLQSKFCAGGIKKQDTCSGDSGGPLMCLDDETGKYHLHGITSYGPSPCGQDLLPGIYTEVSEFRDWIEENAV